MTHHLLPRVPRTPRWLLVCLALYGGLALAAPAPWYYWRSKIDGHRLCAQVSPGTGWERDGGPYEGPLCQPRRRVLIVPMR